MWQQEKLEQAVVNALEKHAVVVERAGRRRWAFTLANGRSVGCTAKIEEGWLTMYAQLDNPVHREVKGSWWELLCLNAQLGSGAKFVLAGEAPALCLGAEIPVDEDVDVQLRVHETCAAFKVALERFHAGPGARSKTQNQVVPVTEFASSAACDLQSLCEQTGWTFNQRADESGAFDLPARSGFHQALVRRSAQDGVSVFADLAESAGLSVAAKEAVGLMLLRASHLVRGVRATAEVLEGTAAIRVGTAFRTRPAIAELEHALAAVAVACDLCGSETVALQDEEIAESYLRFQGWDKAWAAVISDLPVERNETSVIAA